MARPLDLSSVVTKIRRANDHLQALSQEIDDFVNPDLYAIRTETYRQGRERRRYPRSLIEESGLIGRLSFREVDKDTLELWPLVDDKIVYATVPMSMPTLRWSAIIGDVINNARSALDNLIWALTDANSGPPPLPPLSPRDRWRDLQYPVAKDAIWWKDTAVPKRLWGLTSRQRAIIKRTQPFYRRSPNSIRRHWLVMLEELWNADKHRALTLARGYHGWATMELVPDEVHELVEWQLLRARPQGVFKESTEEIARIRIKPRRDRIWTALPRIKTDVKVRLIFEVLFDNGAPTYGANVITLLNSFLNRIVSIVYELKPDLSEPLPVNLLVPPTIQSARPPGEA